MIQTVNYSMEVPKESKELIDALEGIIAHFVAGKSVTEAAALLPAVMAAVDGLGKLAEESKSEHLDEAVGYGVHKIMGALRGGKSA